MSDPRCVWPVDGDCCHESAPYEAYVRHDPNPWPSCPEHAREAMQSGLKVDGPED